MFQALMLFLQTILKRTYNQYQTIKRLKVSNQVKQAKLQKFGISNGHSNHASSNNTLRRKINQINALIEHHDNVTHDQLNVFDGFVSMQQRSNMPRLQANESLANAFRQQFQEQHLAQMRAYKHNRQRLINMTFTAHRRRLSHRDLNEMNVNVCFCYALYNIFCFVNLTPFYVFMHVEWYDS